MLTIAQINLAMTSGILISFLAIYDSWGLAIELKKTLNYVRRCKHASSRVYGQPANSFVNVCRATRVCQEKRSEKEYLDYGIVGFCL
jgi:hypothetical protein